MKKFNQSALSNKGRRVIFEEAKKDGVIIQRKSTSGEVLDEFILVTADSWAGKSVKMASENEFSIGGVMLENVQRKKEVFKRVVMDGGSISDTCELLGVSAATCRKSISDLFRRTSMAKSMGRIPSAKQLAGFKRELRLAMWDEVSKMDRVKRFHE